MSINKEAYNTLQNKYRMKAMPPDMGIWLSAQCDQGLPVQERKCHNQNEAQGLTPTLPKVKCKLKTNCRNFHKQIIGNYFHKVEKTQKLLRVYPT